jgi:tRNA threonylcarbamoyl adenosine modification protein YeaZ
MILAINTAQAVHELALLRENPANPGEFELLAEKRWPDAHSDVEELTPFLKTMLEELGLSKEDLTDIVVVKGPGPFTSLRTGVAFANALAAGLGARLHALTSFELLRRKAAIPSVLPLLHAGRLDIGLEWEGEIKVGPLAPLLSVLPHGSLSIVAELPETLRDELHSIALEKGWKIVEGHELQTLGEMVMTYGLTGLESSENVEPAYLRGAHITKSSDPWKQ